MRYLGGKKRLGREIAEILVKYGNPAEVRGYIEPFCGALGVMVHMVDKGYKVCKAYDLCEDLILLWQQVRDGTFRFPKKIDYDTWEKYKNSHRPSSMRALYGFGLSFGSCWFGGYVNNYASLNRNSLDEIINSIKIMAPYIKKIDTLECRSYDSLIDPKGYLIYCDPPYEGTKKYGAVEKFDSEKFWETVRKWSKDNIVIVSEFTAPSDFKCIWKKKRKILLTNGSIKANPSKTEKLFMHDPVRQKRFSYKK